MLQLSSSHPIINGQMSDVELENSFFSLFRRNPSHVWNGHLIFRVINAYPKITLFYFWKKSLKISAFIIVASVGSIRIII